MSNCESKGSDMEEISEELNRVQAKLREAQEESSKHLNESKQFMQLKKLLREKSEQVVDLRRRLALYEPDDAKEEDA
ncbi:unnamed protein product [Chrysoparadoxa australica]